MIDRISQVSINHEGKYVGPDFAVHFPASQLEPITLPTVLAEGCTIEFINTTRDQFAAHMEGEFLKAANARGYHGGDEVEQFAAAARQASLYVLQRVSADGGDRKRFRRRRERNALLADCMANAGVPSNTIWDYIKAALSIGFIALPTGPWAIVIAAIVWALDRYMEGA